MIAFLLKRGNFIHIAQQIRENPQVITVILVIILRHISVNVHLDVIIYVLWRRVKNEKLFSFIHSYFITIYHSEIRSLSALYRSLTLYCTVKLQDKRPSRFFIGRRNVKLISSALIYLNALYVHCTSG